MHAVFLGSGTPKHALLMVLMGKGALLFVPSHNHCCLTLLIHLFVCALWSSLEQQNFMLSARGLSLPVTNVKVLQTLRTGLLPVTPDVLCFQQIANWQQQCRACRQLHLPAWCQGGNSCTHLPLREANCRISRNYLSRLPFPHHKWEQWLPTCTSLITATGDCFMRPTHYCLLTTT